MDGKLDPIIEALIASYQAERMKQPPNLGRGDEPPALAAT